MRWITKSCSTLLLSVVLVSPHASSGQGNVLLKSFFDHSPFIENHDSTKSPYRVEPLPLILSQFNHSHVPYPVYNGSLANSKGYSLYFNTGFILRNGSLIARFSPEYTTYVDPAYEGFPDRNSDVLWSNRYAWWNQVEVPENTFDSLAGFGWGQSFVGLEIGKITTKLSNENYWWGPGKFNAPVLSPNAGGFPHVAIQSNEPLSIGLGELSFTSITGLLQNSGLTPPDTTYTSRAVKLYVPKPATNRMLSGLTLDFRPKFLPRLQVGLNNVTQQYTENIHSSDYFSGILSLFLRGEGSKDQAYKQQIRSYFLTYRFEFDDLVLYFERVKQNPELIFSENFRSTGKEAGFLFGLDKGWVSSKNIAWRIQTEFLKLSQNPIYAIRNGRSIYLDPIIRQGYTHKGELLGANTGIAGNQQTFALKRIGDNKMFGFEIQRLVYDLDFYYFAFDENRDFRRYWVDIASSISYQMNMEAIILHLEARHIFNVNYQWEHAQDPNDLYFAPGRDISNWQLQCHVYIPVKL